MIKLSCEVQSISRKKTNDERKKKKLHTTNLFKMVPVYVGFDDSILLFYVYLFTVSRIETTSPVS